MIYCKLDTYAGLFFCFVLYLQYLCMQNYLKRYNHVQ